MFYFNLLEGESNIAKDVCGFEYIDIDNDKIVYRIKLLDINPNIYEDWYLLQELEL